MIDLIDKQLSEAIFELAQELNRGAWLADRFGGEGGGIGVEMVRAVKVKASVTARPGSVLVESIAVAEQGAAQTTSTETGSQQSVSVSGPVSSTTVENSTQTQAGRTDNVQSGGNTNTTTNTFGEAV